MRPSLRWSLPSAPVARSVAPQAYTNVGSRRFAACRRYKMDLIIVVIVLLLLFGGGGGLYWGMGGGWGLGPLGLIVAVLVICFLLFGYRGGRGGGNLGKRDQIGARCWPA